MNKYGPISFQLNIENRKTCKILQPSKRIQHASLYKCSNQSISDDRKQSSFWGVFHTPSTSTPCIWSMSKSCKHLDSIGTFPSSLVTLATGQRCHSEYRVVGLAGLDASWLVVGIVVMNDHEGPSHGTSKR